MPPDTFERIVAEEFPQAVPEKYRGLLSNVAFVTEDEPCENVRREHNLGADETLLGLYHGVPAIARGDFYGVGMTMPDTVTLFRGPILEEAHFLSHNIPERFEETVRKVVRDTIWHEVAHHFGYDEEQVRKKEGERG